MSESNVIPFPTKGNIADDKHTRLRKFFDLVAEAADECEVLAYTCAALHAPDPDSEAGCVHTDTAGMADSIDGPWVEQAIEVMSESIDASWHAVIHKVEKNIRDHEASDAAKAAAGDEEQDDDE